MRILTRDEWTSSVTVEGYRAKNEDVQAAMNGISPGYFEALGVPLLAGRDFRANDTERIKKWPSITVPCLVLAFEHDIDSPPLRAREAADAIPGSRVVEIADASHLGIFTHAAEVAAALVEFFAGL